MTSLPPLRQVQRVALSAGTKVSSHLERKRHHLEVVCVGGSCLLVFLLFADATSLTVAPLGVGVPP